MLMTKTGRTKLLDKRHTGKIRPHKHTSYGSLMIVLFLAFLPLLSVSHTVSAAPTDDVTGIYGQRVFDSGRTGDYNVPHVLWHHAQGAANSNHVCRGWPTVLRHAHAYIFYRQQHLNSRGWSKLCL